MLGNNKPGKRPVLVWVVFIYYLMGLTGFLLGWYKMYTGEITVPGGSEAYIKSFDFIVSGLDVLIGAIGAVMLFYLRKVAFYFFIALAVITPLSFLRMIFVKNLLELYPFAWISFFVSISILAFICVYIKRLEKRGILR